MKIGRLDRLLTLQRNIETGELDSLEQPIKVWTRVATFWGQKIHKSEDEKFAAEQRYAVRVVTFRAHYRADIKETDRLICDGATYHIKGARELGYREGIEISAQWQD